MNFASGKIEGANESLTITRDGDNRITSVKTPSGPKSPTRMTRMAT